MTVGMILFTSAASLCYVLASGITLYIWEGLDPEKVSPNQMLESYAFKLREGTKTEALSAIGAGLTAIFWPLALALLLLWAIAWPVRQFAYLWFLAAKRSTKEIASYSYRLPDKKAVGGELSLAETGKRK